MTTTETAPRPRPALLRTAGYLLLNLPTGVLWFGLLVALFSAGAGTAVVWVGLPILWAAMMVARAGATAERGLVRAALGVDVPSPYRPLTGGPWQRWRTAATDPATWRDVLYLLICFPLGIIEFVLVVTFAAVSLACTCYPLYFSFLPPESLRTPLGNGYWYVVDGFWSALPYTVVGLLLGWLTTKLVRGLGAAHGGLAAALLGPTRAAALAAKADHLQASRARGVEAAEAERRRIERDLHDGAQQRLVAVAMGLGRAKAKLDADPDAARELIDEAHADAKQAIAELRDLARGIYPSVLGDRGLDAALSALAAKCPIPVDLTVDVEPRPPAAVESTAYFTVGEALTNIAKHARASRVEITVRRTGDRVLVEVVDNGVGGAEMAPGGGLAGLADRAATIDGVVIVLSPPGGPTVLRAELPCVW